MNTTQIKLAFALGAAVAMQRVDGFLALLLALAKVGDIGDVRIWIVAHFVRPKTEAQQAAALDGLFAQLLVDMTANVRRALSKPGDPHDVVADYVSEVLSSKGWIRWAEVGLLIRDHEKFGPVGLLAAEKFGMLLANLDDADKLVEGFAKTSFCELVEECTNTPLCDLVGLDDETMAVTGQKEN
jgi:hypothetical protein